MGSLVLPPSGWIYVDANAVIYAVEQVEPYSSLLKPVWQAATANRVSIVTSELTWLETLAMPMHDGNIALESLFRAFLMAEEITLAPATLAIWEEAARLRGLGLKTPDAIHAATGLSVGCALFLTNDRAFARVPGLPVAVLCSVLAS